MKGTERREQSGQRDAMEREREKGHLAQSEWSAARAVGDPVILRGGKGPQGLRT